MSNFCHHCNLNIEEGKSHCPLCGKCLDEKEESKSSKYPKYLPVDYRPEPICNILIKLLLLGTLICIGLDLFIFHTMHFSIYVLVCVAYFILMVLMPIRKRLSIAQILTRFAYYNTLLLLFLELMTNSWGWGICVAVPFTWLGIAVVSGVLMLVHGWVNFEMFRPMLNIAVLSTISLILLLCYQQVAWPTLVAFLVSWSEILLMFMFRFKRSVRSLKKEFGI